MSQINKAIINYHVKLREVELDRCAISVGSEHNYMDQVDEIGQLAKWYPKAPGQNRIDQT